MLQASRDATGELSRYELRALVLVTSISFFNMGYNSASISSAFLYIDPVSVNCTSDRVCLESKFQKSTVVAACLFGAVFGSLASPSLVARFGFRNVLAYGINIFYILGPVLSALAPNVEVLVLARAIVGVPIGVTSALVHIYIGELVPASCRGSQGAIVVVFGGVGILMQSLIGLWCGRYWRVTLGVAAVPALLMVLGRRAMPHTPRRFDQRRWDGWHDLWLCVSSGQARAPLAIGTSLQVIQQFTGINIVVYYGPLLYQYLEFSVKASVLIAMLTHLVQILGKVGLAYVVDDFGRRTMSFIGLTIMSICLLSVGMSFEFKEHWPSWLTLVSLIIFRLAFSFSIGSLPFIITAEIFPSSCSTCGASLCWAINWAANFAVSLTFLPMVERISQSGTFFVYAGITASAVAFLYLCLPETAGRVIAIPDDKKEEAGGSP